MSVDWDGLVLGPLLNVFGEPVTYSPASGPAFPITGIFDKAYREVSELDGIPVSSVMPVLGVRLASFPAPPLQGDQLTARGIVYAVREVQPDGHGSAKLMLNYVSG